MKIIHMLTSGYPLPNKGTNFNVVTQHKPHDYNDKYNFPKHQFNLARFGFTFIKIFLFHFVLLLCFTMYATHAANKRTILSSAMYSMSHLSPKFQFLAPAHSRLHSR